MTDDTKPVPPSPDDTKRATVLPPLDDSESIDSWLIRHADFVPQKYWGPIRVLGDAIAALRAELVAESLEVTAWRTRATKAEIERDALLLRIPNVSKVEAECRTLEDWKLRAMHMEFGWSSCSRCAAQLQGRAESAEAERDALRESLSQAHGAEGLQAYWRERAEAERDALRAQLHEIARLWDIPPEAMPQDWRDLWRAAIDAARKA